MEQEELNNQAKKINKSAKKNQDKRKRRNVAIVTTATILAGIAIGLPIGVAIYNNTLGYEIVVDSSVDNFQPYKLTVKRNTTIQELKTQIKELEGHDFLGLFKDKDCTQRYADSDVLNAGDTVYVKFGLKHYQIILPTPAVENQFEIEPVGSIDLNYVEYGTEFKFVVNLNEAVNQSEIVVKANGQLLTPVENIYSVVVTSQITITVEGLAINQYTVEFYEDEACTQLLQTQTVNHNETAENFTPTKQADETYTYSFLKWVDKETGEELDFSNITKNKKAYAVFTPTYIEYSVKIPEHVTITKDAQQLTDQSTLHYGDEIEITTQPSIGHQVSTLTVNGATQKGETTTTYTVTGNITIEYKEEYIPYFLTINEQDKVTVKRNEEILQAQNAVLHYGDELEISYSEQEGYNIILIVDGATKQENGKYIVESNVSIIYSQELEPPMVDKLTFTFETDHYSVKATNKQIAGEIEIPSTYDDTQNGRLPVVVGSSAFSGCTQITSLVIGNQVTSIGASAFNGCTGLTSITIGASVATIGSSAFSGCTGLTEIIYNAKECADFSSSSNIFRYAGQNADGVVVTIGEQVKHIPNYLFNGLSDIKSVTIGSHVESIGDRVFYNCSNIGEIIIPESVTTIGTYAFYGCTGLTSITIGASVATIGSSAFSGCTGLTEIIYNAKECADFSSSSNIFRYAGQNADGVVVTIGEQVKHIPNYLFNGLYNVLSAIKSVTIGSNVESIGSDAFYNCTGLARIIIPENVTNIGVLAFGFCNNLTEIIFNAKECADFTGPSRIFYQAGQNADGVAVTIGDQVKRIPNYLFDGLSDIKSVTIGSSVATIGTSAFSYCIGLEEIIIPEKVTSIGDYAFYGCSGLTSVTIGANVESIGINAFYNCSNMGEIIIPESVTTIGSSAFSGCSSLTSVTIGSNVESIDGSAFSGCRGLTEIIFNAKECADFTSLSRIFYQAGQNAEGISVTIGEQVKHIPNYLFSSLSDIKSVTIGSSVATIGTSAFSSCTGLTEIIYNAKECADFSSSSYIFYRAGQDTEGLIVTIGDQVKRIPNYLFNGLSDIKSVTIGSNVESIGDRAFYNCSNIGEIIIPESVTKIGDYAFAYCASLTSFVIPESITSIGAQILYGCSSLTSIVVDKNNANYTSRNSSGEECNVIVDVSTNTLISGCMHSIIPNNIINIGGEAFAYCTGLTSITIPESVTSIGVKAFIGCSGLTSIVVDKDNKNYTSRNSSGEECNVIIEISTNTLIYGCMNSTIPDNVIIIDDNAFYNCTSLKEIIIPESVTSIGSYAFNGCSGLTSVTIGSHVESIGNYAFQNCTGLTSIIIPESVTSIGSYAFRNCAGLTSVTIGSNVASIGSSAFNGCSNLNEVIIDSAAVFKAITSSSSSNGYLTNYLKSGGTVKVLADADDNSNDYLNTNFTRSEQLVDGYWVYTKN